MNCKQNNNKKKESNFECELIKNIKACMAYFNLSAREIAQKIGISPAYISLILTGKRKNNKILNKIICEVIKQTMNK